MIPRILKILLFAVFIADLFFVFENKTEPRFFTKTLLLPLLILIYITDAKQLHNLTTLQLNKIFLAGLVLSFFGDLFLLFKWGFLAGLGSFLLAHLFYIFSFSRLSVKKPSILFTIILLLYVSGLLIYLFPYLNEMRIPVVIYGVVIAAMLYFAVKTSNRFLILGALFFVISDSFLSVNLFVKESTILSVLVMITYVAAQWFLVKGMLANPKKL